MDTWDIRTLEVQPHYPEILRSDDGAARAIALNLPAGEELQEHEVHEHAYLVVIDGEVSLSEGGQTTGAGPGFVAHWDPKERHEVRATADARLLLVLAPWPGEGHPSLRDQQRP
jgi:quercetin dioxygenase-like cupin family protein